MKPSFEPSANESFKTYPRLSPRLSIDTMQDFLEAVAQKKAELFKHPLYRAIQNLDDVRLFMNSHVFAVWDFMMLLKSLQRELTNLEPFWYPPKHPEASRLINEIVLAEESDEIAPGQVYSHCHLYLRAMKETHADTQTFEFFLRALEDGLHPAQILDQLSIPQAVKDFVKTTLALCGQRTHQVASAFLFGREDVIPQMFLNILDALEAQSSAPLNHFRVYLKRHVELDSDHHGPMLVRILDILCEGDPKKLQDSYVAAERSIDARMKLWDGILEEIRRGRRKTR